MNIYQAMNAVMKDVQAVGKDGKNTHDGYRFRGIDGVTNAVGPALRKHGVIVVPTVLEREYETVIVGAKDTKMASVRLLIKFTWYGPDGDSIESVAAGEAFDRGDKATAKAHSVAFRTAMIQTLCLPTDEPDPDEESYERSTNQPGDLLAQAKQMVWKIAQAREWNRAQLADEFAGWSQGAALAEADAETLNQFAQSLGGGS